MKRIIFPLIIIGSIAFMAVSCNQNPKNETAEENYTTSSVDTSGGAQFTEATADSTGKQPPVKPIVAGEMRTISDNGRDLEVTTMYAGDKPKQLFCKTIGKEEEARYYFNSQGTVSQLDEIHKEMSGEYVQEIFIYVADSLQVAVVRKADTREGLQKANAKQFVPASSDIRGNAKEISKKGYVLLVSKE